VIGEKTSEQHLMNDLERAADQWRHQGIPVHICDFTAFPKLDVFPAEYVVFVELIGEKGRQVGSEQFFNLFRITSTLKLIDNSA